MIAAPLTEIFEFEDVRENKERTNKLRKNYFSPIFHRAFMNPTFILDYLLQPLDGRWTVHITGYFHKLKSLDAGYKVINFYVTKPVLEK